MSNEVFDREKSSKKGISKNAISGVVNFFRDISFLLSCDEISISPEWEKSEFNKFLDSINWLDVKDSQINELRFFIVSSWLCHLMTWIDDQDFNQNNNDDNSDLSEIDSSILKFIETKTPVILDMKKDEYSEKEKQMIAYAYKQWLLPWKEYVLQEVFWDLDEFIKKYYNVLFVADLNPF